MITARVSWALSKLNTTLFDFQLAEGEWRRGQERELGARTAPSATCTLQTRDKVPDWALFLFVSNGFSEAIRLSETGISAKIGL